MRDGPRWKVWLHEIKTLSDNNNDLNINTIANVNAYSCTTRTIPLSEREKVIDLHERLAHASVEAMCNAISGLEAFLYRATTPSSAGYPALF